MPNGYSFVDSQCKVNFLGKFEAGALPKPGNDPRHFGVVGRTFYGLGGGVWATKASFSELPDDLKAIQI
jgi:hypothetical protein